MKLAKSILGGVAALGIAAGSAVADDSMPDIGTGSTEYMNEPIVVYEESWVISDPLISDTLIDEQLVWNDSQSSDEWSSTWYSAEQDSGTDPLSVEEYDLFALYPEDPLFGG